MNGASISLTWSIVADLLAMVSLILALYILVLNPRQLANRIVSIALVILDVNIVCVALILDANTLNQAELPSLLLAAVAPAIGPALMLAVLILLKPAWVSGRMLWLRIALMVLAVLPAVLTLVDVSFGTELYYLPLDSRIYIGGYIDYEETATGLFGQPLITLLVTGINYLMILPLAYFSFFDRMLEEITRWLARLFLAVQVIILLINGFGTNVLPPGIGLLLSSSIYNLTLAYVAFRQMKSEQRLLAGQLRTRLTGLALVISIPTFIFIAFTLTRLAEGYLEADAIEKLKGNSIFLSETTSTWLHQNALMLQTLASQPGIISMEVAQQKPILDAMAVNYNYMYLISTTDTNGLNVARSDAQDPIDYNDRYWFKNAVSGAPLSYQTLIGRTTGEPALVMSTPILGDNDKILGVSMFASYLTTISEQTLNIKIGNTGYAYVVDNKNQLVAHPALEPGETELVDYSDEPPVAALRAGQAPPVSFVDENGVAWRAYYADLGNGWGVVVQQQEAELSQPIYNLQRVSLGLILIGGLILFVLVWVTIRQAVQPINSLTETVKAIAGGDLNLIATVESEDEVGTLARAFNSMTSQLRSLISSLERRVAERTLDLEHRSAQLQAAAEVGRAAATIRNLDDLLPLVTRLVSERFSFYHVGIFLLDDKKEFALLRAANSPGGQRMLARGHKLEVGQQGIVGYVTGRKEPRVALNVGEDAAFFNNPDLPDTQSEMALPLMVGGELLGALDVQSTQPNAFTEQDVETFQVLADQVAIAINSARLVQQTEELLQAERRAFGEISRQAWSEQVGRQALLGYVRNSGGLTPLEEIRDPGIYQVLQSGEPVPDPADPTILYLPVKVRDQVIGVLKSQRAEKDGSWSVEDIELMRTVVEQLGVALESARSYQQTQLIAQRERLLSDISSRVRETLDVVTILRTATQEVRQALGLPKVVIRLGKPASGRQVMPSGEGSPGLPATGSPPMTMTELGSNGHKDHPVQGASDQDETSDDQLGGGDA